MQKDEFNARFDEINVYIDNLFKDRPTISYVHKRDDIVLRKIDYVEECLKVSI